MHGGERLLDIDARVGRQGEPHLAAPGQDVGSDNGAQLGQQHGDSRSVVLRRSVAPERLGQLVAADPAGLLEHEVGEEDAPLAAREPLLQTDPRNSTTRCPQSWT